MAEFGEDLIGWLARRRTAPASGRAALTNALRTAHAETLSALLPGAIVPDEAFTDPRLFAWTGGVRPPSIQIGQLLRLADMGGPGNLGWTVPMRTDESGVLYWSRRGHWFSSQREATLAARIGSAATPAELTQQGRLVDGLWQAMPRLPGTNIEWVQRLDPVLAGFLDRHVDGGNAMVLEAEPRRHDAQAGHAMQLLCRYAPTWHAQLCGAIDSVLLFHHPRAASFAALGLHGMIGLNLSCSASVGFFIDGLAHQGGHVAFTEATLDRQAWFNCAPDDPLRAWIGEQGRARTVYEALHGLFTTSAVLAVQGSIPPTAWSGEADRRERLGRMALAWKRLRLDLDGLSGCASDLFSPAGLELLTLFEQVARLHPEAAQAADWLDLNGHGEDFDATVFHANNPAPSLQTETTS